MPQEHDRVVVSCVRRQPDERAVVALGPLAQQRRLAIARGRDSEMTLVEVFARRRFTRAVRTIESGRGTGMLIFEEMMSKGRRGGVDEHAVGAQVLEN